MKTLEELNLVDDFLVNSLTSHKIYGVQSARYILECILHRQIGKLTVVPQRFFCGENLETHSMIPKITTESTGLAATNISAA